MSSGHTPTSPFRHLVNGIVGAAMGAAEVVPGFSGGTVALVAGIYPRLVANIRAGAHVLSLGLRAKFGAAWRALVALEWAFLGVLLVGMFAAIFLLAGVLSRFIDGRPVEASALFGGLVLGGALIAAGDLVRPRLAHIGVVVAVGSVTFVGLGVAPGTVDDPSLWLLFAGASIAVCAWILPGVSGAFLLLLLGLYPAALAAVDERNLIAVGVIALGALTGLAAFSTLLNWLLARAHDAVLAVMIGLLLGSTRVLWPWPSTDGMGDPTLGRPEPDTVGAAVMIAGVAFIAVVAAARASRKATVEAEPVAGPPDSSPDA